MAPIEDSPKPPPCRITLTYPVLNEMSRLIVFCGAGAGKKPILEAVLDGKDAKAIEGDGIEKAAEGAKAASVEMVDPAPYPCGAARTKEGGDSLVWVVDADAAEGAIVC